MMRRHWWKFLVALLAVLVVFAGGRTLYFLVTTGSHNAGCYAAENIKNLTASSIYNIDQFLQDENTSAEEQIATLELLKSDAEQLVVSADFFRNSGNQILSAKEGWRRQGDSYIDPLVASSLTEGLRRYRLFINRCMKDVSQPGDKTLMRGYFVTAKSEFSKVQEVFETNDFSQCGSCWEFGRIYEKAMEEMSLINLFIDLSDYGR